MSNAPVNLQELKAFLLRANIPHAKGTVGAVKEADGSRTIEYTEGDYRMHDNFFGGEPYGGHLVISYKDQPIFMEVYYGKTSKPANEVYAFLREALQNPSKDSPYRGPAEYKKDSLTYKSITTGDISDHTVKEWIYDGNEEIYSATIIGGLIDQNARGAM